MRSSTIVGALAVAVVLAGCAESVETPVWETLPAPAAMPVPDESGLAPVDDIQMWYAIFNKGGGNPVLLIHGGLGDADAWGNQIPALAKSHEVLVADSRGHGRSTRSAKPFGYELMADDYLALLDHLKIDKVALVGWSDGGIIGLDIAMRHPERLTRLFAFGANTNVAGLKSEFGEDPVFERVVEESSEDYERVSPTPDEYEDFVAAINHMWRTQPDYRPEQLGRIVTPTVIADGAYDEAIKREHTEEIARLIPGATLLILPDVSHFAPWQNAELFNRELTKFLDSK